MKKYFFFLKYLTSYLIKSLNIKEVYIIHLIKYFILCNM